MANRHTVNKPEAIRLRKLGYSYKQIALTLGCSEAWCAKELKGIDKGDVPDPTDPKAVKTEAIRILENALQAVRRI